MKIVENYPLSKLTTFRIGGKAAFYGEVVAKDQLPEALDFAKLKNVPVLIIGGGSNLLVSDQGFAGLVIKMSIKGIEVVAEEADELMLKVGSGEVWDDVVHYAVDHGLGGIENLSNIPGLTGAIPIQNVGAYGQEASQVIQDVEVLDLSNGEISVFLNQECGFEYRASKFNTVWKNRFVILSIIFRLSKQPKPNLSYVDLKNYFAQNPNPSLAQIRNAVIEIRKNKFPDLTQIGCAGSFFKNVILSVEQFEQLSPEAKVLLSQIKNKFPVKDGIKIPAAFLLDQLGLKGKQVGGARLWEKQPLVIVNEGHAKAADVVELFESVRGIVKEKTGITLQPEPEFIGF